MLSFRSPTLGALGALALIAGTAGSARAQNEDFLIQDVCVVGGVVTSADPVGCVGATRDLQPGERLPYHRSDLNNAMLSDSWPIHDPRGVTIAIHSKMFTGALNTDPRFVGSKHWDAALGGYDVYGSDGTTIFGRGTADPGSFWTPFFTPSCEAKGWASFPAGSGAFTAGSGTSNLVGMPDCPGSTTATGTATHTWSYSTFAYVSGDTLNTIKSEHDHGSANEDFYYTREYGVTRWESWNTTPGTPSDVQANCPMQFYTRLIAGQTRYLKFCHDWSIVVPLSTSWSPFDRTGYAWQWPIDPLYTNGNILKNTHFGGPPSPSVPPSCNFTWWQTTSPPQTLNWVWQTGVAPMSGGYNCSMIFNSPVGGGSAGFQQSQPFSQPQIFPPLPPNLSFGAILWAPNYTGGTPPQVLIRLWETQNGALIANHDMIVDVTNLPAAFASSAKPNANTDGLTLSIYPLTSNVDFGFTGSWINRVY